MLRKFAGRFFAALVVVSLSLVLFSCSKSDEGAPLKKAENKGAPDFKLPDMDGRALSMADYKGKVVLLDFWATWCPPCQMAIPHLIDLQQKYGDKGLVVLGLSLDSEAKDVVAFLQTRSINYPIVQCDLATKQAYGVSSIPRIFIVDRQGTIRGDFLGYTEENVKGIESVVKSLL
jgi:thiol-disulfide isomerase/thioredoxin